MAEFLKATKGKKPVRLVLGGPSGSGKTYTALTFAKYLQSITGKPTAAIDTEHYRMSLYADKFDFDVNNWEPPFDPRELIKTIHDVEKAGYGQLIVDSSTHFYNSTGGLLEIVQDAAKQKYGGNQYAGWAVGTPIQDALIDAIIRSPIHMIFCTRAKQAYVESEKNGRKTYEKAGMELQQRDGWEFDFDFSLIMDMDNNANVAKGMGYVPTGAYIKKPDEKAIEKIMKSISENTTEEVAIPPVKFVAPKPEEVLKATKTSVVEKCVSLGGSKNEALMEIVKSFEPSGNPNKIKDINVLNELLVKLSELEKKGIE
jgi:energy-coupling factor transporter ATP-binding protein EcfA2